MQIEDIRDKESFEAWLATRPLEARQQTAIMLASRTSHRILPVWTPAFDESWENQNTSVVFGVSRSLLTSSADAKEPTMKIQNASYIADLGAYAPAAETAHAIGKKDAHLAAARARNVYEYPDLDAAVDRIAFATSVASKIKLWNWVRADCAAFVDGQDILQIPLWPKGMPDEMKSAWRAGLDWMQGNPGHDFWRRWYQAVLDGRPLTGDWDSHWQLLCDIALIPNEDWEKGAEHVAGLIAEIERNYASEGTIDARATDLNPMEAAQELEQRLPLNENVARDTETKRFYLVEDRAHDDPTIETLLELVKDNLDDCLASHNGIRDSDRVARVVRRVLSKYREKPLRIEMDFTDAIKGFRSNLVNGEYDKTDDNSALLVSLEETVRLVRKTHPEVAEVRDHLAKVEMSRLSDNDKAVLADAKNVLVEASKGELAENFGEDIAELLLPVLPSMSSEPDTGNAPPLPGASRTFSRAAKMLEIVISQEDVDQKTVQRKEAFWDRTGDLVRKIDNSATYKGLRIVGTAGSLAGFLWAVVQIGLRVLTVL